jgi:hypothetical protein
LREDQAGIVKRFAETAFSELEAGQFTGELNQLSNRPALAGARAGWL